MRFVIGSLRNGARLAVLPTMVLGSPSEARAEKNAMPKFDHSHSLWSRVLEKNSETQGTQSRVRYAQLKKDSGELDRYLSSLEAVSQNQFDQFTADQKLSFWINAYNAYTFKLILDHYPLKSIRDIGGPWKIRFFTLLGKQRHLDEVEHEIIRKEFNEPRIHFALVCAAKSCPPLRAFRGDRLVAELAEATEAFMKDPARNRWDARSKTLHLSKLFDWYGDDFKKAAGSVQAYVSPYLSADPEQQRLIRDAKARVEYNDYDWNLNE